MDHPPDQPGPPPPESETAPASARTLLPAVYEELRRIAEARLARLGPGQSVQATSLVHEAYLRLAAMESGHWRSREHFVAAAALAMRHILVDHARKRAVARRAGERLRITLAAEEAGPARADVDLLEIDEALRTLESRDERKGRVVTLRFFGGLTAEETARALDVSRATVEREWAYAKAWLHREVERLREGGAGAEPPP